MGAGFNIQIVNATPYKMQRTEFGAYQMEWAPSENISPNSITEFYGEFKETIFSHRIDDAAHAKYTLDGLNGFAITLRAKKSGMIDLPSPNPPSWSAYGVLVEWENIPPGFFVFPPPDQQNTSPAGWIHDGVVTIAIAHFPGQIQTKISPYPVPKYGTDVLENDMSALKPSVLHWAKNWMEQFLPCIQNLKLNELTLPGTHDAGTANANGMTQKWVQTQYLNIQQQLEQGIRALDIRLMISGSGTSRFQLCHGEYLTNLSFLDCVQQIQQFLDETRNEIVILDFHRFEGTWQEQDYKDLASLIEQHFANGKLIPRSQQHNTVGQILATSGRVVVGMGNHSGNVPDNIKAWLNTGTAFWTNAVEQYWCGESTTTWKTVEEYMIQQLREVKEPKDHLWALMAQYNSYSALGAPANLPKEISRFFTGKNGLMANIIHTDWWNRVNSAIAQEETTITNFSALINAVPLNVMKGYRRANHFSLYE